MSKVYLIFGIQGSGKGTQARLLSKHLDLPYFEAGQELRNIADQQNEEGEQIREVMRTGSLVPNKILKNLFLHFIEVYDTKNGLVIDGFPRNNTQAELLEELARELNWEVIVIHINLSKESAMSRLTNRFEVVDGKKIKRKDDLPEIIEKRFSTYYNQTLPMIKEMEKNYKTYEIDGEPSVEEVAKQIAKSING
ncbi:nucleoside monophosphate kinase [Candidatus Berkelbacteria bacterium]|nr:nucleoside monophosphate kinase [Candidatus Berkelbacteria bacterium]